MTVDKGGQSPPAVCGIKTTCCDFETNHCSPHPGGFSWTADFMSHCPIRNAPHEVDPAGHTSQSRSRGEWSSDIQTGYRRFVQPAASKCERHLFRIRSRHSVCPIDLIAPEELPLPVRVAGWRGQTGTRRFFRTASIRHHLNAGKSFRITARQHVADGVTFQVPDRRCS